MNKPPRKRTRFRINLPGFTAELEGDRKFVEDLYHKISRDVGPILEVSEELSTAPPLGKKKAPKPENGPSEGPPAIRGGGYTWVYMCTQLFNKVYVLDNTGVDASKLGRFIDVDRVRRMYINKEGSSKLIGLTSGSRTLWAEFTDEGRALLRNASLTEGEDTKK